MKRHPQQGFTLIELLIAMTIFAVLSGLAYRSINALITAELEAEASLNSITELQRAIMIWERDVRQILPRPVQDEYGTVKAAINILEYSDDGIVEMTCGGYKDWTGEWGHRIQRVRYLVEKEQLIRETWRMPDYISTTPSNRTVILSQVKNVDVSLQDDTPANEERPKDALPKAISLDIEHSEYGTITRLLPLYPP